MYFQRKKKDFFIKPEISPLDRKSNASNDRKYSLPRKRLNSETVRKDFESKFFNGNIFSIQEERESGDDDSLLELKQKWNQIINSIRTPRINKNNSPSRIEFGHIGNTITNEESQEEGCNNHFNLNEFESDVIRESRYSFSDKDTLIYPFVEDEFVNNDKIVQHGYFDSIFSKSFSCIENVTDAHGRLIDKKQRTLQSAKKFQAKNFTEELPFSSSTPCPEKTLDQQDFFCPKYTTRLSAPVDSVNKKSLKKTKDTLEYNVKNCNTKYDLKESDPFLNTNMINLHSKNNLKDEYPHQANFNKNNKLNFETNYKNDLPSNCKASFPVKVSNKQNGCYYSRTAGTEFDIFRQPLATNQHKPYKNPKTPILHNDSFLINSNKLTNHFSSQNLKNSNYDKIFTNKNSNKIRNYSERPIKSEIHSAIFPCKVNQGFALPKSKIINDESFNTSRTALKGFRDVKSNEMKKSNNAYNAPNYFVQQSNFHKQKILSKNTSPNNKPNLLSSAFLSKPSKNNNNMHPFLFNQFNAHRKSGNQNLIQKFSRMHNNFASDNYSSNLINQMNNLKQSRMSNKNTKNHLHSNVNYQRNPQNMYQNSNIPSQVSRPLLNSVKINKTYYFP